MLGLINHVFSEINSAARVYNSTINNPRTAFQPIQNLHNEPVQGFPNNGDAISHLTGMC